MGGINLSHAKEEEKLSHKKGLFDKGLTFCFVIFVLVLSVWGGLEWYIKSIGDQITAADKALEENAVNLTGRNVDRVADLNRRLGFIQGGMDKTADLPETILPKLESLIVPSVTLTAYTYDKHGQMMSISGLTDNFRHLAEQLLSFKLDSVFYDARVDTIARTKEGKIAFALKAAIQSPSR